MTTTAYVTAPNAAELERAWWELMQGELGIEQDSDTEQLMSAMFDHVQRMAAKGVPVHSVLDGEPLRTVSSTDMAARLVAAYAALFYGA